jgi:hypothetical protein
VESRGGKAGEGKEEADHGFAGVLIATAMEGNGEWNPGSATIVFRATGATERKIGKNRAREADDLRLPVKNGADPEGRGPLFPGV